MKHDHAQHDHSAHDHSAHAEHDHSAHDHSAHAEHDHSAHDHSHHDPAQFRRTFWISLVLTVVSGLNYVWKARDVLFASASR